MTSPVPDNTFVRVSARSTGTHYSATRHELEANPDLTELKQDAVDKNGNPLPPKYKINLTPGPGHVEAENHPGPKEGQK